MDCYLHIGAEKTGSTTLQNFLKTNRNDLLSNGVAYTKSLGDGTSGNIGLCLLSFSSDELKDRVSHFLHNLNSEGFSTARMQQTLKKKLKNELLGMTKNNDIRKLIFSSEHVHGFIHEIDGLERLKFFLNGLGVHTIKIVVYLRNPADFVQSLYSTAVRFGHVWSSPPSPDSDERLRTICNHKATIERFQKVFGNDAVIPRIFQRDKLKGGDIVTDFFHIIGEPLRSCYKVVDSRNESLSYTGVSLLDELNKKYPRKIKNIPNFGRYKLIDYFEKYLSGRYEISQELRSEYDAYFKESNEWVQKHFFPEEDFLFKFSEKTMHNSQDINLQEITELVEALWTESYFSFTKRRIVSNFRYFKYRLSKNRFFNELWYKM